jgi:hypothetical protein
VVDAELVHFVRRDGAPVVQVAHLHEIRIAREFADHQRDAVVAEQGERVSLVPVRNAQRPCQLRGDLGDACQKLSMAALSPTGKACRSSRPVTISTVLRNPVNCSAWFTDVAFVRSPNKGEFTVFSMAADRLTSVLISFEA